MAEDNDPRRGGAPDPPGPSLEPRVARLEADVSEIKTTRRGLSPILERIDRRTESTERQLTALEANVARDTASLRNELVDLKVNVARIDGRVGQLPTTVQLIGLVLGIFGLAFALLKFNITF